MLNLTNSAPHRQFHIIICVLTRCTTGRWSGTCVQLILAVHLIIASCIEELDTPSQTPLSWSSLDAMTVLAKIDNTKNGFIYVIDFQEQVLIIYGKMSISTSVKPHWLRYCHDTYVLILIYTPTRPPHKFIMTICK